MTSKSNLKNKYAKAAATLGLVGAIISVFYLGLILVLGTSMPVQVVTTGDMCTETEFCDGYSHVFSSTLHVGDLIFIQSLNFQQYNEDYPNSDIIVFQNPVAEGNSNAIQFVHRIVAKYQDSQGIWHFQTKGDGNGVHYTTLPQEGEYDSHTFWFGDGVPQDLVYGRVVMRIPYIGLIVVFVQNNSWTFPALIFLIALIFVAKFALPIRKICRREKRFEQQNQVLSSL